MRYRVDETAGLVRYYLLRHHEPDILPDGIDGSSKDAPSLARRGIWVCFTSNRGKEDFMRRHREESSDMPISADPYGITRRKRQVGHHWLVPGKGQVFLMREEESRKLRSWSRGLWLEHDREIFGDLVPAQRLEGKDQDVVFLSYVNDYEGRLYRCEVVLSDVV